MLNEEQREQAFQLRESIWSAVHDLVDKMTEGVADEIDDDVRQHLTEQFRFWRRWP